MEVQRSLSDSERFGSVDGKFRRAQVAVQRDDGFVLERRPLLSDLEQAAVRDQDVLSLQLDVGFVKHQRPSWQQRKGTWKI